MSGSAQSLDGRAVAEAISRLLGWTYFLAWSVSFYPQPYYNWVRKSVSGLSLDFQALNLLGFTCYTISTAAFLWSPIIRRQYAERHPDAPETTVRLNDFAFALHAALCCAFIYSQFFPSIWGFTVGLRQRASKVVVALFIASFASLFFTILAVSLTARNGLDDSRGWAWIDVVNTFGYVKLMCSVVKYCPQVYLNYQRKSTKGWSIIPVMLDLTGGILSFLQLGIDSSLQGDWSGVTDNPVKLGLSNTSLFFDTIFLVQRYILYREKSTGEDDAEGAHSRERLSAEHEPLL